MRNLLFVTALFLALPKTFAQSAVENHTSMLSLLNTSHTAADGILVDAGYSQTYSSLDEDNPTGDLIITYENERGHEISLIFVADDQQKSVSLTFVEDNQIALLKKQALEDGFVIVNNETKDGADRYYYQKGNIEMELAVADDFYTYTLRRL